mmetsp:Transcript_25498/g.73366  ORF Transcript_25498/g.73366 Transcript_25498/m.73366 type:complete len:164 (-) Transcript_25498:88-579(-)
MHLCRSTMLAQRRQKTAQSSCRWTSRFITMVGQRWIFLDQLLTELCFTSTMHICFRIFVWKLLHARQRRHPTRLIGGLAVLKAWLLLSMLLSISLWLVVFLLTKCDETIFIKTATALTSEWLSEKEETMENGMSQECLIDCMKDLMCRSAVQPLKNSIPITSG